VFDVEAPADLTFGEMADPFPDLAAPLAEKMAGILVAGWDQSSAVHFSPHSLIELRDLAHSRCDPAWRYSDNQLRYHYTKDKTFLSD